MHRVQPLEIEEDLWESLSTKRDQRYEPDEVEVSKHAILLFSGLGSPGYLTRDGWILWLDWDIKEAVPERVPDRKACGYLLLGSKLWDEPRLADFIPKRPPDRDICAKCSGTRWWPIGDDGPLEVLCPACGGVGWL